MVVVPTDIIPPSVLAQRHATGKRICLNVFMGARRHEQGGTWPPKAGKYVMFVVINDAVQQWEREMEK